MMTFEASNRNRFKMNMAPLIDVVFLLLIFFLLTSSSLGQGMDIRFPQGQASATKAEPELVVRIDPDNTVRVGDRVVEIRALFPELEARLKNRARKSIVIEADKKARYGLFARVLDIARQAGAEDFSIVR